MVSFNITVEVQGSLDWLAALLADSNLKVTINDVSQVAVDPAPAPASDPALPSDTQSGSDATVA